MLSGCAVTLIAATVLSSPLLRIPLFSRPFSSTRLAKIPLRRTPQPWRLLQSIPIVTATHPKNRSPLRVYRGIEDVDGKYSFIVALLGKSKQRTCTGTLIAPTWVLTAAHCNLGVRIQYGDMSVPRTNITSTSDILKWIPHPSFRKRNFLTISYDYNDIAMILVQKVPVSTYGVLSALDYRTMVGYEVQFAGLGRTSFESNRTLDFMKPVGLGVGMVRPCNDLRSHNFPEICVAPKCTDTQSVMRGDSGGPLLLDGRVVGVNVALYVRPMFTICTPVSPYISWIQEIMLNEG